MPRSRRGLHAVGILAIVAAMLASGCGRMTAWRDGLWKKWRKRKASAAAGAAPLARGAPPPPVLAARQPAEAPKPQPPAEKHPEVGQSRILAARGALAFIPPPGWSANAPPPNGEIFTHRFPDGQWGGLVLGKLTMTAEGYTMYGARIDSGDPDNLVGVAKAYASNQGGREMRASYVGMMRIGGILARVVRVSFRGRSGYMAAMHFFVEAPGGLYVFRYAAPTGDFDNQASSVASSLSTIVFPRPLKSS